MNHRNWDPIKLIIVYDINWRIYSKNLMVIIILLNLKRINLNSYSILKFKTTIQYKFN